jgi:hypothetical protein
MKEPHRKGLANRSNPESCAGGGNIAGEALTGAVCLKYPGVILVGPSGMPC